MSDSSQNVAIHCRATTSKGKQCTAYAVGGGEYCFTHSPEHAQERASAHLLGGKNRRVSSAPLPFPEIGAASARGLAEVLAKLIEDTWKLKPSAKRARTLAYLIRIQQDMLIAARDETRRLALDQEFNRRIPPSTSTRPS